MVPEEELLEAGAKSQEAVDLGLEEIMEIPMVVAAAAVEALAMARVKEQARVASGRGGRSESQLMRNSLPRFSWSR